MLRWQNTKRVRYLRYDLMAGLEDAAIVVVSLIRHVTALKREGETTQPCMASDHGTTTRPIIDTAIQQPYRLVGTDISVAVGIGAMPLSEMQAPRGT